MTKDRLQDCCTFGGLTLLRSLKALAVLSGSKSHRAFASAADGSIAAAAANEICSLVRPGRTAPHEGQRSWSAHRLARSVSHKHASQNTCPHLSESDQHTMRRGGERPHWAHVAGGRSWSSSTYLSLSSTARRFASRGTCAYEISIILNQTQTRIF